MNHNERIILSLREVIKMPIDDNFLLHHCHLVL